MSEIAFSSRLAASAVSISSDCSATSCRASVGLKLRPKNSPRVARFIGSEYVLPSWIE